MRDALYTPEHDKLTGALKMYQIYDSRTGAAASGAYKSRKAAQRRADLMDAEYGAVRYVVKRIA